MKCPHSVRESAATCSQCLQASGNLSVPVRQVDVVDGTVQVDGKVVRLTVEKTHAPGERFRGRA